MAPKKNTPKEAMKELRNLTTTKKENSPAKNTSTAATITRKTTKTKIEAPMIVRLPHAPTFEEIAKRAFLHFERRRYIHGMDQNDWFQAERELREEYSSL